MSINPAARFTIRRLWTADSGPAVCGKDRCAGDRNAAFTARLTLSIRRQPISWAALLMARPMEDKMRAEAQKLADGIEEAFGLLRRSL